MSTNNDELFQEVYNALQQHFADVRVGENRNDGAHCIIGFCVAAGLNTKPQICQMSKAVGYNTQHVAKYLDTQTGASSDRFHWYRDAEGRYLDHPAS